MSDVPAIEFSFQDIHFGRQTKTLRASHTVLFINRPWVEAQIRDVPGAVMSEINKYFLKDLKLYWHCEWRDRKSGTDLLRALNHPNHGIDEQAFKALLAAAIEQHTIGLKECEDITGLDFESPDEIAEDLRELWQMMYE